MKKDFYKSYLILALTLSAFTFGGCASLKVDTAKMQSIKKVAIIGFDVLQQQPVRVTDLIGINTQGASHGVAVGSRSEQAHVGEMYDMLVQKLAAEKGYAVVKRAELIRNPAYAAIYERRTHGVTSRPFVPEHYLLYQAPNVLDGFDVSTLSPAEQRNLAEALKVDAVLVVKSVVELNTTGGIASLVGQASMSPSATTTVAMTDAHSGEEIWSEPGAKGDRIANEEKSFLGMGDNDKLNLFAKKAVASSVDSAFQRIKAKTL
jgi:hypothetical protein